MKQRATAFVAVVLVLGIVFVGGWISAYPSQNDPKNIRLQKKLRGYASSAQSLVAANVTGAGVMGNSSP